LKKKEENKHRGYAWPGLSPPQNAFLNAYIVTGSIAGAHQRSGKSRTNHYYWLRDSEPYQDAYADATKILLEELEADLHRRATEGVHEPVVYQGQFCHAPKRNERGQIILDANGHTVYENAPMFIRRPSDVLLMFRLKKLDPSYRENSKVEVAGTGGGPLSIEVRFVKAEGE
jgi:hypothetical protein